MIATRLVAAITPPVAQSRGRFARDRECRDRTVAGGATDPDELIRECDAAMYHAKDSGPDAANSSTNPRAGPVATGCGWRVSSGPVENGDFELHYQPIVDATSIRIVASNPSSAGDIRPEA